MGSNPSTPAKRSKRGGFPVIEILHIVIGVVAGVALIIGLLALAFRNEVRGRPKQPRLPSQTDNADRDPNMMLNGD